MTLFAVPVRKIVFSRAIYPRASFCGLLADWAGVSFCRNSCFVIFSKTKQTIKGLLYCLLKSHAIGGSCKNRVGVNAVPIHMPGLIVSNSVYRKHFRGGRIVNLLLLRRPLAVFWRIISIIVNSINGMFSGRLLAHIKYKIGKSASPLKPSFTHLYATPAVVFVMIVFFVIAPFSHSLIAVIFVAMCAASYSVYIHLLISCKYNTIHRTVNLMQEYNREAD